MSKLVLRYSASEALEMMKQNFPNDFQDKINVGKQLIIRLKKMYKKPTHMEAYQRYINSGCRVESGIMMLCALQELIVEERENQAKKQADLNELLVCYDTLLEQQSANETCKNIIESDKRILRQFYKEKLADLKKQIDLFINEIEVVDASIVSTPTLFNSYVTL